MNPGAFAVFDLPGGGQCDVCKIMLATRRKLGENVGYPQLVCPFSAYMLLCVISFDNRFISQHLLHRNRDEINLSKYNTQHNIKKKNKKNPSAPLHCWTPLDCIV